MKHASLKHLLAAFESLGAFINEIHQREEEDMGKVAEVQAAIDALGVSVKAVLDKAAADKALADNALATEAADLDALKARVAVLQAELDAALAPPPPEVAPASTT